MTQRRRAREERCGYYNNTCDIRQFLTCCAVVILYRTMKVLVFSLALLLILTYGEALECSHCVPPRPGGSCVTTVEKCGYGKDACARARFLTAPYSHFRRCIKMSDCRLLQTNAFINIECCNTDRCNA
ncbi:hypothetical protein ANANG_G00173490 [Anguilla anguilla]|uniref:Uncharacterized protein n=1 Tax=Anguilla anguilla TaxID=7936 RepID=A0A9D3M3W8_ANGAN|nr:hypothetical protein ANANG_G00173490 [Anguilla anguilla]